MTDWRALAANWDHLGQPEMAEAVRKMGIALDLMARSFAGEEPVTERAFIKIAAGLQDATEGRVVLHHPGDTSMTTDSLQATDDYSAARSTAPRVSLQSMEKRIVDKRFFTVGEALTAIAIGAGHLPQAPRPDSPLHLLTVCVLVLDNGWVMLGKSAPASAENFDVEKGQTFAYEDAIRQLWPLEGYLLRERLWTDDNLQRLARAVGAEGAH